MSFKRNKTYGTSRGWHLDTGIRLYRTSRRFHNSCKSPTNKSRIGIIFVWRGKNCTRTQTERFIASKSCSSSARGEALALTPGTRNTQWESLSKRLITSPWGECAASFHSGPFQRALWKTIQGTSEIPGSLENNLCLFLSVYTGRSTTVRQYRTTLSNQT